MKAKRAKAAPAALASSHFEFTVTQYFIARQVIDDAKKRIAEPQKVLMRHIRKCRGRREIIDGWEFYLVKRNTLRFRPGPKAHKQPQWQTETELQLSRAVSKYLVQWQRIMSRQLAVEGIEPALILRLQTAPGHTAVIAGIECRLIKKSTIRMRVVGYNPWGAVAFKPFPDDE